MSGSERPRARRTLLGAAAALVAALLLATIAILSFQVALRWRRAATTVAVPDLTGLTRQEAEQAAARTGLGLEVAGERNDPAVPSGRVLQQGPPPEALVRRQRKVKVVLSLGQQELTVPEVAGRPTREVEVRIRQEGLEPGDEARIHTRVAPGVVVAQWPPAGNPAVTGMRVHRLVSEGPEPSRFVMPDLTGRTVQAALRWMERCGFRKGTVRRLAASGTSSGLVIGQWPLAGYPVRPRAVVELTVAQ